MVGAGPTGPLLAGDLGQAGVRTLLLERRHKPSAVAKAGGLSGQILQLLHYRGELNRFRKAIMSKDREAATSTGREPIPRLPFGGLHLDFSQLQDSPMRVLRLPQPRLERVLAERLIERGSELRRGDEVIGLHQDSDAVNVEVRGPAGVYEVLTQFVVGCDGGRSRVRDLARVPFSGTSLPEIERLASVTVPDSVTVLKDGGLQVHGAGKIPYGYTPTERGVFACSGTSATMGVYTAEVEGREYDDDVPMTVSELSASVSRVLGVELPLGTLLHTRAQVALRRVYGPGGDALRALILELSADEQPLRRLGALMAGTDVGSPISPVHPLVGAYLTDRALHVEHEDPQFVGVLRTGRPVLLDLTDQPGLRELADQWADRIDVARATIDEPPVDALLIRPDGLIAWAAPINTPSDTALPALREALRTWFGVPST